MNVNFSRWALEFSGCDGGDIGTPSAPSVWFCGIEWGGGHSENADQLRAIFQGDESKPPKGYEDPDGKGAWRENLAYIYNRQAVKLLSAINGGRVEDYKIFAERIQPFTNGAIGYFKMNLFPLAFRNTNAAHWGEVMANATGLPDKAAYLAWIREHRFQIIHSWVKEYRPKLIVCTGITYYNDFIRAFSGTELAMTKEVIEDRELRWARTETGTLLIIIPFMVNRYGLTRNSLIQMFGDRIRELSL